MPCVLPLCSPLRNFGNLCAIRLAVFLLGRCVEQLAVKVGLEAQATMNDSTAAAHDPAGLQPIAAVGAVEGGGDLSRLEPVVIFITLLPCTCR